MPIVSLITTPTPDENASVEFYHKLGFRTVPHEGRNLVTDGRALIEIDPSRFARAGLKLFSEDWVSRLEEIESITAVSRVSNGYLIGDPSGVWVYLIEDTFEPAFEVQDEAFGVIGNFAGLSFESTDIAKSLKLWKTLGFSQVQGSLDNGWISCTNPDGLGISLMKPNTCPHLFFNPSMTYFNSGRNPEIIARIRELEIPITEEVTYFNEQGVADNIIIRDPGGYGIFVFND